ncbi:MAG: ABC transporter [Clostridia bacterium BRH_c25]|nr:MAG: ABC transporter [Clostridia bacterium BRH_c25]
MRAFSTLLKTESKLMLRGMDTPIFGVAFPVGFAVILGMIVGNKPAFEGADFSFLQQSFGALTSIGICATGLMSVPLTVADYRHKKVLKRFRVTPVSPALLLLVQFVISFMISVISMLLVYSVCALFFGYRMIGSPWAFMLAYMLVLLAIYAIGMMLASISPNIKTANLLCSLVYFPMLLLSGATIPYEVMPKIMQKAMDVLPLTQGIKLLKGISLGIPTENVLLPIILMAGFTIVCTALSLRFFRWE